MSSRSMRQAPPRGELCRWLQVSTETLYRWKRKCGGLDVSEARRLRLLEGGNRRLKRLVAEPALGKGATPLA